MRLFGRTKGQILIFQRLFRTKGQMMFEKSTMGIRALGEHPQRITPGSISILEMDGDSLGVFAQRESP